MSLRSFLRRTLLGRSEDAAAGTPNESDPSLAHAAAKEGYHRWYFDTKVWASVRYRNVPCLKSVSDIWNYQEILSEMKPALVIEFGTRYGGSALFFADLLERLRAPEPYKVITVDIDHSLAPPEVRSDPRITFVTDSSASPAVREALLGLRRSVGGRAFAIVDSDHAKAHVLAELRQLRDVLSSGDYLVVEDTNLNGHPVRPDFGPGPMEALEEYETLFPNDYRHDRAREEKYGFTFAPRGFLIRVCPPGSHA